MRDGVDLVGRVPVPFPSGSVSCPGVVAPVFPLPGRVTVVLTRQAYRELAKIHQDKAQGEEEKLKSEELPREIAQAYEVLPDDELPGK